MQAAKKYIVNKETRYELIERIAGYFRKDEEVSFAYIYGSFNESGEFNDIDVAVYLEESFAVKENTIDCQLELGVNLERELKGYTVDCRVLNTAPLSFRFSVITSGDLIYSKDEAKRVSFEVMTRNLYFDFKPHADFYYQKIALGR
ncbi:MAG: nucleotidyltransferase domain-containing protein [Nitrospirae bacterium]|nr:nucleotidyltransferase domain-containing protein [Nitrospirota bacterium]